MGGLSCIFQPFAQANNPELGEEDYNRQLDLVLGLQRHVPSRNDAAHAQRPLRGGRPAGRQRNEAELAARDVPLEPELGVRRRGGELPAPRGLRLSPGAARPLGLGSPHAHEGWEGPVRATHRGHGGAPRPLPVALREARALPRHARGGGRGRQAAQVPAGRAGSGGCTGPTASPAAPSWRAS